MSENKNPSIIEVLRRARKTGGLIRITGYCSSDGSVGDYVIRMLGSEGYRTLVQASLKSLMAQEVAKPDLVDGDTWLLAKNEQVESWGKTLSGEHSREFNTQYQDVDGLYARSEAEPETVMLRNLELVDKKQTVKGEREVNSKAKTLAKKYIVDNTPMGKYLGQMKLSPGKFEAVSNVE